MGLFIVFLGGGLGAALRHGINLAIARLLGDGFPYGRLPSTSRLAGRWG